MIQLSNELTKTIFSISYINVEGGSGHGGLDSKRKWFTASISQLCYTLLLTRTCRKLGILIGKLFFLLH